MAKKTFWISAYTTYGSQFGATIIAENDEEMFQKFHNAFGSESDIADYGDYGDSTEEEVAEFGSVGAEKRTEEEDDCGYEDADAIYSYYFGTNRRDDDYIPLATRGDYSPSHPWDAPGMSMSDFI